ncbi:FAD-dependent oxidoreductase [Methylomonas sp. MED-D]|uniref:FAD-dependent oxidoreductase n=1 Tax=unclassified Methylomonas TaxID=2608980 RepID=UPI0028A55F04|nr:FAD-dependent oxidoreductase [Methylomonas sp. MV1]MDT4329042.1 FAD-dependent oxidoreductase [Methylomonas sp. MV1]
MEIGIVGGGVNGLCCAWQLAKLGHRVSVYERGKLMRATSCASSKLLHGGLRYLENGELRLVRESLRERDAWLRRAPHLTEALRLRMPLYRQGRRGRFTVGAGLFIYDRLAGRSLLPGAVWLDAAQMLAEDPGLDGDGLLGGYEFSDGRMDDYALGVWVAEQARTEGVEMFEDVEVLRLDAAGLIETTAGVVRFDRVLNVAGPWAGRLLERSGVDSPYRLDLVRGSHLLLNQACRQAYLLEVPGERRIFFVLPWKGQTLLGTTEVRQGLDDAIACSDAERDYLLAAYKRYFPNQEATIAGRFAGVRPLISSAADPSRATREYAVHRTGQLISVFGGKWTTALALAEQVAARL